MIQEKWDNYLAGAHNPPSMSATGKLDSDIKRKGEIKNVIYSFVRWPKSAKILCLGCGDGYEIQYLNELGYKNVIGITNHAQEIRNSKVADKIIQMDMHDLDFPDGRFDYVYSKEVLEHSPAPYIVLCELNRVTTTGFLHLISTSPEKQREWYHFSCFPDWIWLDLFYKTDFAVEMIYENKIELGFSGKKIKNKDFNKKIQLYDLDLLTKATPRMPLKF